VYEIELVLEFFVRGLEAMAAAPWSQIQLI